MKALAFLFISFSVFAAPNITNIATFPENSCQFFSHCQNEKNPLWHKILLGADLADIVVGEVLQTTGKGEEAYATIAVSESGFDSNISQKYFTSPIQILKGSKSAGDPNIDVNGKGTSLSAAIGLKTFGLTSYSKINSYRVNAEYDKYPDRDQINEAVKTACSSSDVVVLNWGSSNIDKDHYELMNLEWYKYAYDNGCLIIMAVGNSFLDTKELPLNAPLITVASVDEEFKRSFRDKAAKIYTPTSGMFSLISSKVKLDALDLHSSCLVNNLPFKVSYEDELSSSAIAASASQVITILKARGIYPKNPQLRILVLNKILTAAAQYERFVGSKQNNYNALIAALIAKHINTNEFSKDLDTYFLSLTKEKNEVCNQKFNCEKIEDCNERFQCLNNLRKNTVLCHENVFSNLTELVATLKSMNEKRLAYTYLIKKFEYSVYLNLKTQEIKDFQINYLKYLWETRKGKKFNIVNAKQMIYVMQYAHELKIDELYTVENFLEIISKPSLISLDLFEENSTEKKASEGIENSKAIHQLYLSFSKNQRTQIVEGIQNLYQKGLIGNYQLQYILQLYSSEPITSPLSKKIRNIISNVTKHSLKLIPSSFSIDISKYVYEQILYQIPSLKEELKAQIKEPYIDVKFELFEFAKNYPKMLLPESEEVIAKKMLFEIYARKEELKSEMNAARNTLIASGHVYDALQKYSFFIFSKVMRSNDRDPKAMEIIKYLFFLEAPISHYTMIPSFSTQCKYNQCELLDDKDFINKYLNHLESQIEKSLNLETLIDSNNYRNHVYNFVEVFDGHYSYLNSLDNKFNNEHGQTILKLLDLATEKLLLIRKQPEMAPKYQIGMDYQKFHFWKLSAHIADDLIQKFIKSYDNFSKVNQVKEIMPKFKQKIVKIYNHYELDELGLSENTLDEIKEFLQIKE